MKPNGSQDAGATHAMVAGSGSDLPVSMPPSACGSNEVRLLASAPENSPDVQGLSLFQQVGGSCPSIAAVEFPLRNISDASFEILSIATTDERFAIAQTELPRRLEPNDRIILSVAFSSMEVGEFPAQLVVSFSDVGCQTFALKGTAVSHENSGLVTFSPYIMDFNRVAGGTTSPEHIATFVIQPDSESGAISLSNFNIIGNGFIISSPLIKTAGTPCESFRVGVRFLASRTPGFQHATLQWEMVSMFGGQPFDALVGMELEGTAE